MSQSEIDAAVERRRKVAEARKRCAGIDGRIDEYRRIYGFSRDAEDMHVLNAIDSDDEILADAYLSQHAAIATDKVSAALARLEEHHERGRFWGTHYYPVPGVPGEYFSGIADVGMVIEFAKRVLSQHAGDDGEAVSEILNARQLLRRGRMVASIAEDSAPAKHAWDDAVVEFLARTARFEK